MRVYTVYNVMFRPERHDDQDNIAISAMPVPEIVSAPPKPLVHQPRMAYFIPSVCNRSM